MIFSITELLIWYFNFNSNKSARKNYDYHKSIEHVIRYIINNP